jgi:quercetin dioxygenase-like cupin family protein
MQFFSSLAEQKWDSYAQVENILGREGDGDFSFAFWEPGQVSQYHCHPFATEIYFCISGGGIMRTPIDAVEVIPGSFVVHPQGELHEYENGPQRTSLFRVRYGRDRVMRFIGWRGHPEVAPTKQDEEYFAANPPGITFEHDRTSR